ncbi:MAG: nucleotide exchange factor GrpE [Clostridia bacterium]
MENTQDTPIEELEVNETVEAEVIEEVEVLSETEVLQNEITAKQDAFLRLTAEYDNFRKRSAKERDLTFKSAVSFSAEAMLPVYDTLSSALNQIEDESPHKKGFELTLKQLEDAFTKLGISHIDDNVGTTFDANLHNAVMHVEDADLGENVIAETFQKGFKIGDKVVRHSMVKVAN